MENLLTTLAKIVKDYDLPVLLIGGHAVTALGHPRATFDVDLLIPRHAVTKWQQQIEHLGYRVFAQNLNFIQFESTPDWPLPAIDLMLVDEMVFDSLFIDRCEGASLATPNVVALIALKLHAINQPTREYIEKDWYDVLTLIDIHRLTLDDVDFFDIVERHGGQKAIGKIRTHLAGKDKL